MTDSVDDPRMTADSAFSYACRRCGKCCIDKTIQINPYETARLARRLGETTAQFRERWTDQGVALKRDDENRCIFYGEAGCSVHSDRPLVCRLFPLGRHISSNGGVRFSHAQFTPEPGGLYGEDGRIGDYLQSQGAGPFIAAADAYFAWYCNAVESEAAIDPDYDDLLDMDAVVATHARKTATAAPDDIEARTVLHLAILNDLITAKETHP